MGKTLLLLKRRDDGGLERGLGVVLGEVLARTPLARTPLAPRTPGIPGRPLPWRHSAIVPRAPRLLGAARPVTRHMYLSA